MSRLIKRLLRLEIKRAEGIYYDRELLHRAVVVQTPFGKRLRLKQSDKPVPPTEGDEPLEGKKSSALESARSSIGLGLPVGTGFFASMVASEHEDTDGGSGPLAGVLSDDSGLTGVVVERVTARVGKTEYSLSAAARKADVTALLKMVQSASSLPVTCEPALFGALQSSWNATPPTSGSNAELRLWVGEVFSFVSLTRGRLPLALEEVPRSSVSGSDAIVSAIARILGQIRQDPNGKPLKRFIVHGEHIPPDLLVRLESVVGISADEIPAGPLDGQTIAEGLAYRALTVATPSLNLARSLQKPPSILATLPWLDMFLLGTMTAILAIALGVPIVDLDRRIEEAKGQQKTFSWAQNKTVTQLKKEVSTLKKEIEPLSKYLTEGLQWTPILAEIPGTLPVNATLTAFHGEDMIWAKRQEKEFGERFMLLRESTPLGPDGSAPVGIGEALVSLRDSKLPDLGFSVIRLTDVHWRKLGSSETTGFSIVALPKTKRKSKSRK